LNNNCIPPRIFVEILCTDLTITIPYALFHQLSLIYCLLATSEISKKTRQCNWSLWLEHDDTFIIIKTVLKRETEKERGNCTTRHYDNSMNMYERERERERERLN